MFSCVPRKKLIYLQSGTNATMGDDESFQDMEYTLKPEDVIGINIFSLTPGQFDIFAGRTEASNPSGTSSTSNLFKIDKNGDVELPAVGDIHVEDLTIKEAQSKIRDLLEDYLKSPLVRITLQTPFEFTVLGEVARPGRYALVGEELNILEALGTAGDLTHYADRGNIKVVRKKKNGEPYIVKVNILDEKLLTQPEYNLRSEDIIIVDPLKAQSIRENQWFFITSVISSISTISLLIWNLNRINN